MIKSIWGEEFDLEETPLKNKQLLEKLNNPKKVELTEKNLKSKTLPLKDRLNIINTNVERILGKQKENTLVIRDRQSFTEYIDKAIKFGRISIDTETNNSLDPLTCKLMGPCIYVKGEKQVYIPLHHINNETGELLPDQLTEKDVKEEFQRLVDANTKIIMHNGKFDYKVIHCTCGIDLPIYWDTMLAARLLDENESSAGLKQQYIDKIDPEQEKYDIEHLFENVAYEQVDPGLFALYAATDAMMTDKLYEWQVEAFKDPEQAGSYHVFKDVEMPLTIVVAKMELRGILLDKVYAERLSAKYHKLIDECNLKVQSELDKLKDKIDLWRLSKEANEKPKKKTGNGLGKSKNEKLADPISVDSPTQLSILLYDILECPVVNQKEPRGTGVDELKSLAEKTNLPICNVILEKRGLSKLLNTFIDKLPNDVNSLDGKIHGSFNQLGTDCITGDSIILTSTGVSTIQDIIGDVKNRTYTEFNYPLINENNNIEYTSHKIKFNDVDTYKITLPYGFELEGTPNHPIRILENNKIEWRKLEDISINDIILISKQNHPFTQDYLMVEDTIINEHFAQLLSSEYYKNKKIPVEILNSNDKVFNCYINKLTENNIIKLYTKQDAQ